jgi:hypothetical protein
LALKPHNSMAARRGGHGGGLDRRHVRQGTKDALTAALEGRQLAPHPLLPLVILGDRESRELVEIHLTFAVERTERQRWSRHRQWDVAHDTLATHLALVDESLLREVGQ